MHPGSYKFAQTPFTMLRIDCACRKKNRNQFFLIENPDLGNREGNRGNRREAGEGTENMLFCNVEAHFLEMFEFSVSQNDLFDGYPLRSSPQLPDFGTKCSRV